MLNLRVYAKSTEFKTEFANDTATLDAKPRFAYDPVYGMHKRIIAGQKLHNLGCGCH